MTTAEIITIGTELLLGETVDTNTRFIARALRDIGVDIYRTVTVGDNHGRIVEAIRDATRRAEIIITTGGLGPTIDDPTRQAVAEAVQVELVYREELWQQIVDHIRSYGRVPSENQRRQAYIPKGSLAINNPVGTAPAFIVETKKAVIICLPGVPREMETLLSEKTIPYLQKRFNLHEVIKVRTLHIGGLGESRVDEQIGDLEMLSNPTVGLAAHSGIIDMRITAKANSEAKAGQMIQEIETIARDRLGDAIFGSDHDTLEQVVVDALERQKWHLAIVEHGMKGALSERLRRTKSPMLADTDFFGDINQPLTDIARTTQNKTGTEVVVVVSLDVMEAISNVGIVLLTPDGLFGCHLSYGGHQMAASRWACNMVLDLLRRTIG